MTELRSVHVRQPVQPAQLPVIGPAVVTMGVFDGVHRGHRALLAATREAARERGAPSVALVFEPHPDEVLRPGISVPRLAPLGTNLARIEVELAIDHALPLRFDDALRQLTAEDFMDALAPAITLQALVMSPESAFGRGRGGTVARLREIGAATGFEVITVGAVLHRGEAVSSRRIREAIESGDLDLAAELGSPARLVGTLHGAPGTTRLAFDYEPALPPPGRYHTTASRDGRVVAEATLVVQSEGRVEVRPGTAALPALADAALEFELRSRI